VNGLLDENASGRRSRCARAKAAALPRNFVAPAPAGEAGCGAPYRARRSPAILPGDLQSDVASRIKKIYGDSVDIAFGQNPALIGGLRIKLAAMFMMAACGPNWIVCGKFLEMKRKT